MAEEVYKSNLETETEMSEKLVLIDGHSILNRAFFGIPDLTNSEGLHTVSYTHLTLPTKLEV